MNGSLARGLAVLAAVAALLVPASSASAAAAKVDPTVAAAARIIDGAYTASDIALVESDPKMAEVTPDPNNVVVTTTDGTPLTGGGLQSADLLSVICGAWAQVNVSQYSLTGSLIYRWTHYVQYCRDGSKVTKWESRYDYLSYSSSIIVWGGLTADQQAGIGTYSAWSMRQRHLQYCVVKYGCYANVYPWSKITVKANGTYSYTWGT